MEYSPYNNSDRDEDTLDDSESYSDSEESEEKESSKKKKKSRGGLKAAESSERSEAILSKEKQDDSKVEGKKSLSLERLFAQDEADSTETEPVVPENPEELSDEETAHVTKQLVEARDDELHAELGSVEPDSLEEAEVLANALYIDKLSQRMDGDKIGDAELDALVVETATELDLTTEADAAEEEPYDVVAEAEEILRAAAAENDHEQTQDQDTEPAETSPQRSTTDPEADDPGHAATSTRPSWPVSVSSAGGGRPPVSFGGAGASDSAPKADAIPYRPTPGESSSSATAELSKYRRGADMLVGGIIGYLIGRRRGRIKTEERLVPIQKSLEKKVTDLNEKISLREKKIRKLTAEKVTREGEDAKQLITDKIEAKVRARQEAKAAAKATQETEQDKKPELSNVVSMQETLQNTVVESPQRQPERMASMLLAGSEIAKPDTKTRQAPREIVRSMSDVELVQEAASIKVRGQSAKQLYEQGRLSRGDLREVVEMQFQNADKAERLLTERLRPKFDESAERLQQGSHELDRAHATGSSERGGVVAPTPALQPSATQTPKTDIDISAAADALIAAQTASDHKEPTHIVAWVVVVATAALLVTAFFLF